MNTDWHNSCCSTKIVLPKAPSVNNVIVSFGDRGTNQSKWLGSTRGGGRNFTGSKDIAAVPRI
jgi:hypothetical protein